MTSVAVGGPANDTVFAGCWDKRVWAWDLAGGAPRTYEGHVDFVKAVLCANIGGTPCLISGGADKKIIVWEVASGRRLHVLQDAVVPMMAVQCLALDPVASDGESVVLVSAGSDPHIRRWRVTLRDAEKLSITTEGEDGEGEGARRDTILEHDTGVFRLVFDEEDDDVDLWTASADGTAKRLSRAGGFIADDTLLHGDYVRAVAVERRLVATAGRSEDIKIWDRVSGELRYVLEGHYDEVTDLVLVRDGDKGKERLVSVGIDGTVRIWGLGEEELKAAVAAMEKGREKTGMVVEEESDEGDGKTTGVLTAEEEAELAELMADDDEDD